MNKYGYFKVASALPSVRVADCEYNAERTVEMMRRAAERGVRVVVFPELGLTAASCGDLLRQPMLLAAAEKALERVAKASGELGIAAIVGLPIAVGERIFNCAAVVADGQVAGVVPKQHIPNFGEWQQGRWFASGAGFEQCALADYAGQQVQFGCDQLFVVDGVCFGVEIGTDSTFAADEKSVSYVSWTDASDDPENPNSCIRTTAKQRLDVLPWLSDGNPVKGESVTDEASFKKQVMPAAERHGGKVLVGYASGVVKAIEIEEDADAAKVFKKIAPELAQKAAKGTKAKKGKKSRRDEADDEEE